MSSLMACLISCNELLDGLPHQVRRTAEDQSKQLARQIEQQKAVTGESIGAMRLEALSRSTALEAYRQENAALRSQLESETAAARAARAAAAAHEHQKLAAEQKAMAQKETLARKLSVLVAFGISLRATFRAWTTFTQQERDQRERERVEQVLERRTLKAAKRFLHGVAGCIGPRAVFSAWSHLVRREIRARELERRRSAADERAAETRLQKELFSANKEKMASRILKVIVGTSVQRILHAWHELARTSALTRERDEMLHAQEERAEKDAAVRLSKLLSAFEVHRSRGWTRQLFYAWRAHVLSSRLHGNAGSVLRAMEERDALAAQLRLALAGREAEARRVDMVRSAAPPSQ